ncbi:MAG: SUMF1/EgtB/PvdO family nonheme iron enzyme [Candidatus Competibacteraceae bacterium]|nr:SUMF1/EgtB/PvdO family nonheme iron enzyme [Candidatus Competibacteraceae bacterium]
MDIKLRLEELERAHAAGRLTEAEWMRRREDLLREAAKAEELVASNAAKAPTELESGPVVGEAGLDILEPGMVIGPSERRLRLLHEINGKKRIWLALAIVSDTERARGIGDEFRAIKLFLPAHTFVREAGREERSQRADLLGSRTYLIKAKTRIEQAVKLDHPNIARVYGWRYGADGWPFAEMEYVDQQQGSTLAQRLREQGGMGLSWDVVLKWLEPVAAALDYARQKHRFPHQHLDSDSVFLTSQGTIKLLGFGLATEISEPRNILLGSGESIARASADTLGDGALTEAGFRRDVFALALLVYQLLIGQSAYEARGSAANTLPRPPGLTDEAWRILRRGLAYPSELCPIDAGGFIADLAEAQRPAAQARRGKGPLGWHWAAAGVLLLVGLGAYWLVQREDGEVGPNPAPPAQTRSEPSLSPNTVTEQRPAGSLSGLVREAEREADLRAFESAKRVDTLVSYQLYLQRCPRCEFEQEARRAIQNLQTEEKVSKIEADFETLVGEFERENREERGDEALNRLSALAELAPGNPLIAAGRHRVALIWVARAQASVNKGDLGAAQRGLKKAESLQPELPELVALATVLKQTEVVERAKQADVDAFAAARRANSRKAYWAYLERCAATCSYRAEAEAALARLGPKNPIMRDRLSDGSQGPELVVIPAGRFEMGSPAGERGRYNDEQQHPASIAKSFAIGKYELMFFEYERFANATGRSLPPDQGWGRGRRPVVNVSWRDAKNFTEWLSQQTGQRYRLPTETEWEYAARAGTASSRYWGDDPNQGCPYANAADYDGKKVFVGWTVMQCRDGNIYTAPAGTYRNNDYGLHDVLGNVLEWTCSLYAPDYQAPSQVCQEPEGDRQFVVRGGSWNDEPRNVRSADRHRNQPDFRDYFLGFRVVRELP